MTCRRRVCCQRNNNAVESSPGLQAHLMIGAIKGLLVIEEGRVDRRCGVSEAECSAIYNTNGELTTYSER